MFKYSSKDLQTNGSQNQEADIDLITYLSSQLSEPAAQKEPLHPDKLPADYAEGLGSQPFNSVPSGDINFDHSDPFLDEDGVHRSGNTFTTCAHIITAVIGAGILSLPYAMASLGWLAGPIVFLVFALITLYTAQLLADLYIIDGKRQRTYTDMCETVFGRGGKIAIIIIQQSNLMLTALAYTISAGQSMKLLAQSACGLEKVEAGECFDSMWEHMLIFGVLQLFLSQTPNLEKFWWASVIGAAMSFGYGSIALILSWVYFDTKGTIGGIDPGSTSDHVFNILNALGAVLFAYSFSMILLEIQDTIRRDKGSIHGPIRIMKKSVNISVSIMTVFYFMVGVFGYLSEGNDVNAWILDSYSQAPQWVIDMANAMVLIHMIPAYQLWSQPHFEFLELSAARAREDKDSIVRRNNFLGFLASAKFLRYGYRTIYVCIITFLAILMPFFSVIVGLVGALGFYPATVCFPVHAWIRVFRPNKKLKTFMWTVDMFCLVVTIATIIGSVQAIVANTSSMEIFGA